MRKQQGMTLIGILLTMTAIIMAAIVVLRIVPVYLQHYEVQKSLEALNKLPASEFIMDPASNANFLRNRLMNQLYVNSIEDIKPEQIQIVPDDQGHFKISIQYQVIRPLVANIRLLFDFKASQEVKISAE